MKKIVLIALCALCKISDAQITFEFSYPDAGYFISPVASYYQQLYVVKLEQAGEKFVRIDRVNKKVDFFNLNHTPFKSISFAAATDCNPNTNSGIDIMYISQNLFDTDNEIEFMYLDQYASAGGGTYVTQIVNEDGSIIFTKTGEMPFLKVTGPLTQVPIYNTSAGTKMILSVNTGSANVYGLGGILSAITTPNLENPSQSVSLFPNPSQNKISISGSKGAISKINIIALDGKLLETRYTDETGSSREIDISNLPNGEYILQLLNQNGTVIENKKVIRD